MDSLVVECLHCGTSRVARRDRFNHLESPECPDCGYLGWAPMLDLSHAEREELRKRPVEQRRIARIGA
jgi:hypothetical protein